MGMISREASQGGRRAPPPRPHPPYFEGYFGGIRSVARRTLPKNPPKEILDFFGGPTATVKCSEITLSPKHLIKDLDSPHGKYLSSDSEYENSQESALTAKEYRLIPLSARSRLHQLQITASDVKTEKKSRCSKTCIFGGISIYLAIAVLVLIITIAILAANVVNNNVASKVDIGNGTTTTGETSKAATLSSSQSIITTPTSSTVNPKDRASTSKTYILTSTLRTIQTAIPKTTTITSTTSLPIIRTTTTSTTTSTTTTATTIPTTTTPTTTTTISTTTTATPTTTTTIPTTTTTTPTTTTTIPTTTTPTTTTTIPTTTTTTPTTTTTIPITTTPTTTTTIPTTTTPTTTTTIPTTTTTTPTTTTTIPITTTTTRSTTTTIPITTTTTPGITTTTPTTTTAVPTTTTRTTMPSTTSTTSATTTTPSAITTTTSTTTTSTINPVTTASPDVVCESNTCWGMGYDMMIRMNTSADPCENFYSYACDSWISYRTSDIENNLIDSKVDNIIDDTKLNTFYVKIYSALLEPIVEKDSDSAKAAKLMYTACSDSGMDTDNVRVLNELHTILTRLQIDTSLRTPMSLEEMIFVGNAEFDVGVFFTLDIATAPIDDLNIYVPKVDVPALFLPLKTYISTDPNYKDSILQNYTERLTKFLMTYFEFVPDTGETEGNEATVGLRKKRSVDYVKTDFSVRHILQENPSAVKNDTLYNRLKSMMNKVVAVEKRLAEAIDEANVDAAVYESYSFFTMQDMASMFPKIDWNVATGNKNDSMIKLMNMQYFFTLEEILTNEDPNVLKFFAFSRIIFTGLWKYLPFTTRQSLDLNNGLIAKDYTWYDCINTVTDVLSPELHQYYIDTYNSEINISSSAIFKMASNMTKAMKTISQASSLMETETKQKVFDILNNLQFKLIETSPIIDLNSEFFAEQGVSLLVYGHRYANRNYQRLRPLFGTETFRAAEIRWTDMNTVYDSGTGVIYLPLAITATEPELKPTFGLFASIGVQIASQLTTALFGDLNFGYLLPWWDLDSYSKFYNTWDCFNAQVDQTDYLIGQMMTKEIVTGYNNLNTALKEYNRQVESGKTTKFKLPLVEFTSDQAYFMYYMQNFCAVPDNAWPISRAEKFNAILRNIDGFSDAFNCSSSSGMYLQSKCRIFT